MTDVEILRFALKEEEKAIRMYENMLNEHPNLEEMLLSLIEAEQGHKKVIEKKIAELTK